MPALLGITYKKSKALPNISSKCLILAMEKPMHMGEKLEKEADRLGLKVAQIAEFFDVRPPSVYDWYHHGRIAKKHFPKLIELTGRPLEWWLDFPKSTNHVAQDRATYGAPDPRHTVLIDLFEGLPSKEQDELIKTLTEKKQHYDAVIHELLNRRSSVG